MPRWRLALAAALEGVALWLRRQRGWWPWLAAAGFGGAALAGSPLLAGLALLAGLVGGLTHLADRATTSARELSRAWQH